MSQRPVLSHVDSLWKETQKGCLEVLFPMLSTGHAVVPLLTAVHQPPGQLGATPQKPPQQFHGHAWASLHGTGVADTLELQWEKTSVLGTPLGRGSRGWGVPASPAIICGRIICPVPSFRCAGVRLPLLLFERVLTNEWKR